MPTTTLDIVIALLLLAAAMAVLKAPLLIRRKPSAPDPRIAVLAQYEAGVMAHIRERYKCTDEAAREIRRRFLQWELDAIGTPVEIADDGKLSLSSDTVDRIDRCALEIGLRPAPKGQGAV